MKLHLYKYLSICTTYFILSILIINNRSIKVHAEESYLKEIQLDTSTKFEEKSLDLHSNPFQIVEMIRRANSMNDATNPSDAIDDALKSFDKIEEK